MRKSANRLPSFAAAGAALMALAVTPPPPVWAQSASAEIQATLYSDPPSTELRADPRYMAETYGHCSVLTDTLVAPGTGIEYPRLSDKDCDPRHLAFRRIKKGDSLSWISFQEFGTWSGYETIRMYHNRTIDEYKDRHCPLPADLHDKIGDGYVIGYEKNVAGARMSPKVAMPPAGIVNVDTRFNGPRIRTGDDSGAIAGSGAMRDLVVAGQRCLAWPTASAGALRFSPITGQSYDSNGTLWGMGLFCDPKRGVSAFTASERQPKSSPNWAAARCVDDAQSPAKPDVPPARDIVELPIARDVVVIALNREHPLNRAERRLQGAANTEYLNLTVLETCALLKNAGVDASKRYYSTAYSGTLGFVGSRLCGDSATLRDATITGDIPRSENYDRNAASVARETSGIAILPLYAYQKFKDQLIAVAIGGTPPYLDFAKPVEDPFQSPSATAKEPPICQDKSADYCLSRYLYVYADRTELRKKGKLYALLMTLAGAPRFVERLNYMPVPTDMRKTLIKLISAEPG